MEILPDFHGVTVRAVGQLLELTPPPDTRQSTQLVDGNADGGPLAWNSGRGDIFVADGTFNSIASPAQVIIHEIGHNWDTEYDENGWTALSGWVESEVSPGGTYVQGLDSSGMWWYDSSLEGFVSTIAQLEPMQDFAESFANYFMNLAGLTFVGGVVDISTLPGKSAFMDNLLADAL